MTAMFLNSQAWIKRMSESCPPNIHHVSKREFGAIVDPIESGTEIGGLFESQGITEDYVMNTPVVPEYTRQVTCGHIHVK